jgi:hypothetical protein
MSIKEEFIFGDMTEILRGFEGTWVALSMKDGKIAVSGSGSTIDEAIEKAHKKGVNNPTLMRVPEPCIYII